jgi:hypothetical protein
VSEIIEKSGGLAMTLEIVLGDPNTPKFLIHSLALSLVNQDSLHDPNVLRLLQNVGSNNLVKSYLSKLFNSWRYPSLFR